MSRARKIVLPVLELTRVCDANAEGAIKQVIPATDVTPERTYYTRPKSLIVNEGQQKSYWVDYSYNLFPIVLDRDGRPWDAAMAYLFWKIDGRALANMSTFHGIADDLAWYLDFCQEHKIDYTDFPQNKLKRPTYRYHGHLKRQVFAEQIAITTASRRMGSVIGIYRWLQTEGRLVTAHPTWNEKDVYLSFKDARGFSKTMTVQTTDVSVKVPKNEDPYSNTIDDGGKLRPLNETEQRWLFEALSKSYTMLTRLEPNSRLVISFNLIRLRCNSKAANCAVKSDWVRILSDLAFIFPKYAIKWVNPFLKTSYHHIQQFAHDVVFNAGLFRFHQPPPNA